MRGFWGGCIWCGVHMVRGFGNEMRDFHPIEIAVVPPSTGLDFEKSCRLEVAEIVLDCPFSKTGSEAQAGN